MHAMSQIHTAAEQGYSREAETYVRGRPGYPPALLSWLRETLGLRPGKTAIDLGAGTGKFTALLAQTGTRIIAIEPVEAMREQLIGRISSAQALSGTAQSMPIDSVSADVVVCAQAFHWFATEEALLEIHRVLKPDGRLGLIWNVRDESVDWVAQMTAILEPHEGDAPRYYKGEWRQAFSRRRLFTDLIEYSLVHQHVGSPQEVIVDRAMSVSFIAALAQDERAHVLEQLRDLIHRHPQLNGKPEVAFPYRTLAFSCTRLPALAGR
jgi:SAM-dependent methyltransferase